MKFDDIDFPKFNKPPYLFQWLSRGETKDFAQYGDQQYVEIARPLIDMSGQWDLNTITGASLDRMGARVNVDRNGMNDDTYRIMIRLRILLNNTNGSIPDVIKVVKYLYSSEVVHIVEDFPAGVTILHDGEGPDVDFNEILRQVVGAGIDYSTKELFYFTDELPASEAYSYMQGRKNLVDGFAKIGYFHNADYKHNGKIQRKFVQGITDVLAVSYVAALEDRLLGRYPWQHNGQFKHDGTLQHRMFIDDLATEFQTLHGTRNVQETVASAENSLIDFIVGNMSDSFIHEIKHDGRYQHNGKIQHDSLISDWLVSAIHIDLQDKPQGLLFRNGQYKHDGSITHAGVDADFATEYSIITVRNPVSENAAPSELLNTFSISRDMTDNWTGLRHNRKAFHNGNYARQSAPVDEMASILTTTTAVSETVSASETFSVGYRRPRYHNGTYMRNGSLQHNTNALIPL